MSRSSRGAATAELVVALPVLVALTVALTWFLSLGVAQVQVVDAARETARALARGDAEAPALERGRQVGPQGTRLKVTSGAGTLTVTATAVMHGPGGVFGLLPVTVRASATAADEAG